MVVILKQFETDLTLEDDNIYGNLESMCMEGLTKKFVKRCFKSCLILKIDSILQYGTRTISQTAEVSANISLKFLASAIVLDKDEIILGKVVKIGDSNEYVHVMNQYAGINVNISFLNINHPYKLDQIIPIIVDQVAYSPMKQKITVSALPFIKHYSHEHSTIYFIYEQFDDGDKIKITKMLTEIKEKITDIQKLKKQYAVSYAFFTKLLSRESKQSINDKTASDILKDNSLISSFDEMKNKTHVRFNFAKNEIYTVTIPTFSPKSTDNSSLNLKYSIRTVPALTAYSFMLKHKKQYLDNLETLILGYQTNSDIKKYESVWKLYMVGKYIE
jgi:hypothetical protein